MAELTVKLKMLLTTD